MKFIVKAITRDRRGRQRTTVVEGHEVPRDSISLSDYRRVIEVEQLLEKLTNVRWHIIEQSHA